MTRAFIFHLKRHRLSWLLHQVFFNAIKYGCVPVDSENIDKTAEFDSEDSADNQGTSREDVGSFLQIHSIFRVPPALSNNASVQSSPLLNFYLTHHLLHLLKTKFPLANSDHSNAPVDMLTDEESALHYVTGYMIRSLRAKLERIKPNLMEEMELAL